MSDDSRDGGAQVEVWSFRRYDFHSSQYVTSIGKAEMSAIARFGAEAMRAVNSAEGRPLRLRGLNARVVVPGLVRQGDRVAVHRPVVPDRLT